MIDKHILFDLKCLDLGLPPLSGDPTSVVKMIKSMDPQERRRVSRKIRKLSKKAVRKAISDSRSPERQKFIGDFLRTNLNLGPQKKRFSSSEMMRRIIQVKKMMWEEFNA